MASLNNQKSKLQMDAKRESLINALRMESDKLSAKGYDVNDHKQAIEYLITGKYDMNYDADDMPILDMAINNLKNLMIDYDNDWMNNKVD